MNSGDDPRLTKSRRDGCMIQDCAGLKDERAAPMPGPSQTGGGDFSGSQTKPFSGPTGDPTSDLRMHDENEESAAREETAWMHEREALRTEETGGAAAEAQSTEVRGFEELLAAGGCRGEKVAELMCEKGDLRSLGLCFAWMILEGRGSTLSEGWLWQKVAALGRRELGGRLPGDKSLFPFPHVWNRLEGKVRGTMFEDCFRTSFWTEEDYLDAWSLCSLKFCQLLHGGAVGFGSGRAKKVHWECLRTVHHRVENILMEAPKKVSWGVAEIKRDLDSRDIGYGGEEVGKVEQLSAEQIRPSLPPLGKGGSIRLVDWVSPSTRRLLESPELLEVSDSGQEVPRLQGRVHIKPGEKVEVAKLLVEHGICVWRREKEVLRFRGCPVKNGLFGVVKPGRAIAGKETLRVIMNLIPSNAIHKVIQASVHRLPSISQWTSIFLGPNEHLEISQADITSAFYLFELPSVWHTRLAFNIDMKGRELGEGFESEVTYTLCAKVLPMGWSSAVGIMEEAAEQLLRDVGLPDAQCVNRVKLLPEGFVRKMREGDVGSSPFWHIYLDNFASGQRMQRRVARSAGGDLHLEAERGWNERGVLTAPKKSVHRASVTTELGGYIQGEKGWLGPDPDRLVRTLKLSLWLSFRANIRRKSLQICIGRWMHICQFRRASMSHFAGVWEFITMVRKKKEWQSRWELLSICLASCLLHTDLRAQPSAQVTASDASMKAGAVGLATGVSELGKDFLLFDCDESRQGRIVPVLLISLFDGIGGAIRSYNLAGARPKMYVSVELHRPARRVIARRWPEAVSFEDVTKVNDDVILEWLAKAGSIEEIHIWGGFPCKDLSGAKAGRENLAGAHSSLFYQLKRIWLDVQRLCGDLIAHLFAENVCSMDASARDLISSELGFYPYRVDSDQIVPLNRPRFVWTDVVLTEDDTVWTTWKEGFWQVNFACNPLLDECWIDEGWLQWNPGIVYPTCMRAIVRDRPPPRPVGFHRCQEHELLRWRQDRFRFPPYHYKDCYMLYRPNSSSVRYLSSRERETLMGYGFNHTYPAFSASAAKGSPSGYEDERMSLVGDAFPVNTFWVFAAEGVQRWITRRTPEHYQKRLGMFPGACLEVSLLAPIGTSRPFGSPSSEVAGVLDPDDRLVRQLAWRVSQNGSDIRVSVSLPTNPKLYPRQSGPSGFWNWKITFQRRWEVAEHINALEMRSILLSIQWRISHLHGYNVKLLHLSDSAVCISVLAKGRSSSKALQHIVRKIGGLLLATNQYFMGIHVDSFENPTDAASRS